MERESIEIIDASENNLKHVNVNIPKEKLVVIAGVSGSGKSSLAFDTVAAESSREWQATYPLFLRSRLPHYERPAVESIRNLTPSVVVDQRPIGANARSTVGTASDVAPLIMEHGYNNTGQASKLPYEGAVVRFNRLYLNRDISGLKKSIRDEVMQFVRRQPCTTCGGSGLDPKALASKINGYNIFDYYNMQVSELLPILEQLDDPLGRSIADQIAVCLRHIVQVGLGYLSLSRRTDTLSGGEAQRLKMVRHLGSSLSNITYIFDEPTAGLHPADARRIGNLLLDLRDKRNTVLVVEHSRQMIELADYVIELGPLAGSRGGEVLFTGTPRELLDCLASQTGKYLALRRSTPAFRTEKYGILAKKRTDMLGSHI